MRIRDSGMPAEEIWSGYFDPGAILEKLGLGDECGHVVEFGCGYGTFTIPAAQIVSGTAYAIDIDPAMIERTRVRATEARATNVRVVLRDFMVEGSGLPDGSVGFAMVFNILHPPRPVDLLREAYRILRGGGLVGIIHWNYDPDTPRGPDMAFRPRPQECRQWTEAAGFEVIGDEVIDLPPYHYGFAGRRPG